MPPTVAAFVFSIGIAGLFYFDREPIRVSKALWIPTIWLFFCSSRSLAQWLGLESAVDQASSYAEGSPVDRYVFILLEVAALIVVLSRAGRVRSILRRNWALGLFFSYALLSMGWSDYPFVTFKHWIKGIGDVMMVLIILTESDVPGAVKRTFTRIAFLLVPLSLLLIWYYPSMGRRPTMDWTPEAIGVATQKNGLGELCDIVGLALLWRLRDTFNAKKDPNRKRRLLALGVVLMMAVWLLHLCNSMTSIGALILAGCVMLLSGRTMFRRRPLYLHLVVAGVIVLIVFALFLQSSGSLLASLGRNPTLTGRTTVWPELIKLVHHPLVGVGYESFWLGSRLLKVWVITQGLPINEAHSGYVEMLLTGGWVGIILMSGLITTGYRNAIAAYRRDPDVTGLRIAWILAPLITGFTEAAFRMMCPTWIVLVLATTNTQWKTASSAELPADATRQFQQPRAASLVTSATKRR